MVAYSDMFPVLFSLGQVSISSYGVFLVLGFLMGVFLIWRLSRAWDLDEEKILDITLLTILGGLIGARIYFVLWHLQFFLSNPLGVLLFYKYPGFSFWGGVVAGFLALYFFTRRKNQDFWMIADIASVGFLGGLILADLGCFLGGCGLGIESSAFFAVQMVGQIGKRFPIQALDALATFLAFLNLWSSATRFHPRGKIFSLSLIYLGLIKLLTEPARVSHEDFFLSLALLLFGVSIFYKVTKRKLTTDLKNFVTFIYRLTTSSAVRKFAIDRLKKYWYNQKTGVSWKLRNLKRFLRRFNVRVSHKDKRLH